MFSKVVIIAPARVSEGELKRMMLLLVERLNTEALRYVFLMLVLKANSKLSVNSGSVSYTHLDVYKRQVLRSVVEPVVLPVLLPVPEPVPVLVPVPVPVLVPVLEFGLTERAST